MSLTPESPPTAVASAAAPFLRVQGLRKTFGATLALDDVGMDFHAGRIHCILGENGAGKSTLGKIIGGVHAPDAGRIEIEGQTVTVGTVPRAQRLGIAVVFQELSLALDLTVRANLLLGMEPQAHPFARLRHRWEKGRVAQVLSQLQIQVNPEDRVGDLAVATQQLLEVAKVLIRRPRMVVLDEPTAMLNDVEKQTLYGVLMSLRAGGTTLAFITHHLEDVVAVADHVTVMRDGRVVDSFAADSSRDSSMIAEKLSGNPVPRATMPRMSTRKPPFLRIDGMMDRVGNPTPITVASGEVVGLYGVVGCGAARIASALAGIRPAEELQLTLDGCRYVISTPVKAHRLGISYLPTGRASNGILPTRSIRENLNLSLLARYSRAGIIMRRRETAGTRAQLAASAVKHNHLDEDVVNLSGGNQQKVIVARALCAGLRLVILEDPTAGIDLPAKQQILTAIRAHAARGAGVLLISSDLTETIKTVDTLITLYAGQVVRRYPSPGSHDRATIVADVIGHSVGAAFDPCATVGNEPSFEPSKWQQ